MGDSDQDQEYLSLIEGMVDNLRSLLRVAETLPTLTVADVGDGTNFEDGGRIPYPFAVASKKIRRELVNSYVCNLEKEIANWQIEWNRIKTHKYFGKPPHEENKDLTIEFIRGVKEDRT